MFTRETKVEDSNKNIDCVKESRKLFQKIQDQLFDKLTNEQTFGSNFEATELPHLRM